MLGSLAYFDGYSDGYDDAKRAVDEYSFQECNNLAKWRIVPIYPNGIPDDYIHSCTDHVGNLFIFGAIEYCVYEIQEDEDFLCSYVRNNDDSKN